MGQVQGTRAHHAAGLLGGLRSCQGLLLVVFVVYYMFNDPSGLAQNAKDGGAALWDGLTNLFAAVIDFINAAKS